MHLTMTPLGLVHCVVDLDGGGAPHEHIQTLLDAGLPSLQLRGRSRSTAELVEIGTPLREAAREAGARFLVNSDLDAARALDADGVHLPAAGPSVAWARRELGNGVGIGTSCHDLREIARARDADWIFLSPIFATHSKPGAQGLGLDRFRDLVGVAEVPVYALGGVTRDNYESCFRAGAAGVASISALFRECGADFVRDVLTRPR